MGCNAYNHPPDCNCGWGGEFHGAVASPPLHEQYASYFGQRILSGFTFPNARCPVCGEEVFFYQSPNGGRVFFDALGQPWPKHPCTDNSQTNSTDRRSFSKLSGIESPPWTGISTNRYFPIGDGRELKDARLEHGSPISTLFWTAGSKNKKLKINFETKLDLQIARIQTVFSEKRLSLLFYEHATNYWVFAWGMLSKIINQEPLKVIYFEGHLPESLHIRPLYSTTPLNKRSKEYQLMLKKYLRDNKK